jgi:hypothetical protein
MWDHGNQRPVEVISPCFTKRSGPEKWFKESPHKALGAQEGRGGYLWSDDGDFGCQNPKGGLHRFYLYSREANEFPKIYVDWDQGSWKVLFTPAWFYSSLAFKSMKSQEIERLNNMSRSILLKAWEKFYG